MGGGFGLKEEKCVWLQYGVLFVDSGQPSGDDHSIEFQNLGDTDEAVQLIPLCATIRARW